MIFPWIFWRFFLRDFDQSPPVLRRGPGGALQLKESSYAAQFLGDFFRCPSGELGLSENRVPLHPMVNDHYPY